MHIHVFTPWRARTRTQTQTGARAHTPLWNCFVRRNKKNLQIKGKRGKSGAFGNRNTLRYNAYVSKTLPPSKTQAPPRMYLFIYIHARTHPPTVSLVIGKGKCSRGGDKTVSHLVCVSWHIGSLTPAVAAPAWCPPRRFPCCCVAPGSRRASVRSPPCSRQRSSLIFRRRSAAAAAQPFSRCLVAQLGSARLSTAAA